MDELALVKANIDKVLKIPEFTEGNRYKDFNSSTDKIAEYGIGALVGGTLLTKMGFFAVVGKFLLARLEIYCIRYFSILGCNKKILHRPKEKR